MTTALTVELPDAVVQRLEATARAHQKTVKDVVRDILAQERASAPALPVEIEEELAAFASLSDDVLWLLACGTLSPAAQEELAELNNTAKLCQLSSAELDRQQTLVDAYDRMMVRRARAVQILMQRGYNLTDPRVLQAV
jgi:predicted transcriptional regulator